MNSLIEIDQAWLLWINAQHSSWADVLMWYISSRWLWIPLYIGIAALIWWRFGWRRALWIIAIMGCAVGLADWLTTLMKHTICRPRPTHEPALEGMIHIVNGYTGGQYGFPSSHASNTCVVALLFSLIWTRPEPIAARKISHASWAWLLWIWVALNCYSRMYLGVHYPGDIAVGLIVGAAVAAGAYALCRVSPPARLSGSSAAAACADAPQNGGS